MDLFDSPFIVPVAGCATGVILGVGGMYVEVRKREIRARERTVMLQHGIPIAEIERLQSIRDHQEKTPHDPMRSLTNARRTMLVLISSGTGLVLFGALLFLLFRDRGDLVVSAVGLVDICVGLGFLVDYTMQKRELSRFGMDLDTELNEPLN